MLAANSGVTGIAASAGSEAHGQDVGMAGGQPTASANPIVAESPASTPTDTAANSGVTGIAASAGSEAHGQAVDMAGGQPTALVAFDTGGSFKGSKCEVCETAFPVNTNAEKKTKASAREFYLFKKLEPTGGEIRNMSNQSHMQGVCVLKGWKPNLKAEDTTDLDATMAILSERLDGFTGVPSTWAEYKKCSRNYGALCQNCWKTYCTQKNLTPS